MFRPSPTPFFCWIQDECVLDAACNPPRLSSKTAASSLSLGSDQQQSAGFTCMILPVAGPPLVYTSRPIQGVSSSVHCWYGYLGFFLALGGLVQAINLVRGSMRWVTHHRVTTFHVCLPVILPSSLRQNILVGRKRWTLLYATLVSSVLSILWIGSKRKLVWSRGCGAFL